MSIQGVNSIGSHSSAVANGLLAGSFGVGALPRWLSPLGGIGVGAPQGPRQGGPVAPAQASGVITTAYQRRADGDEAFLASRAGNLDASEHEAVRQLSARDAEVRAHEQAHLAAGSLARGGATYQYVTGPDGRRYAVGGSVEIDTSPGATPEETLAKAQQIRAAALAPAEPSAQDRAVALQASRLEAEARAELLAESSSDAPLTDAPLSDEAPGPEDAPSSGGSVVEGGGGADATDQPDASDIGGEAPLFERGSANSAFNRETFPGRGHAYGHFKNEKNANAVDRAAHGFGFGTDPSVAIDDVKSPGDDVTPPDDSAPGDGASDGEDGAIVGGGGESGKSIEDGALFDADAVLGVGSIDLVG